MKKTLLLLLVFVSVRSFSQPVINRATAANTVQDGRGMWLYNAFLPRYADTTAANLQKGIDTAGAIIYTYDVKSFWLRQHSPKKWVAFAIPYSAGYGLTLSSNIFKADTTIITNYRLSDSIAYSSGINYQTIADAPDSVKQNDAASVIEMPNGNLLYAWSHSQTGMYPKIYTCQSSDGGFTRTTPTLLPVTFPSTQEFVPSFYVKNDDSVIMILLGYSASLDTTWIFKTASGDNGTTWTAPVTIYGGDTAYLGAASNRIVKTSSGKLLYPFEVNTNGQHNSTNGNYTGKALASTNDGAGWFLTSASITSPDGLSAENGIVAVEDTLYAYWRNRSGVLYVASSTDDYATLSAPFKISLNSPNTESSLHYVAEYKKIFAVTNAYYGDKVGSLMPTRPDLIVSVADNMRGGFQQVFHLSGNDALYGVYEPDFYFHQNKFILWWSKSDIPQDFITLEQAIIGASVLLPTKETYVTGDLFSWRATHSTYTHNLYGGNFTADRYDTLQNVNGTVSKQLGNLTSTHIPYANASGLLAGDGNFTWNATDRKFAIGGGTDATLNVTAKAVSSTAEVISKFKTADDAANYLAIANATSSGSSFVPQIDALIGAAANQSLYITPQVASGQDAGTVAALTIAAYKNTAGTLGSLGTKPLIDVYNNTTLRLKLTADGNLGVNGTPTFLNGYTNGMMFSGAYPVIHLNASGSNAVPWQMGAGTYSSLGVWELYGNGASRFIVDQNGNAALGATAATAILDIKASTTSKAHLRMRAGVAPSSPNDGDVWYDGTDLKLRSGASYSLFMGLTGSATWDVPSTPTGTTNSTTITIAGAAAGDVVSLGIPSTSPVAAGANFYAFVTAADTVTVYFSNNSGGTLDPASGTYKVSVKK